MSLFPFHKLSPATCDLLHGIAKLDECHFNCCYNFIVTLILHVIMQGDVKNGVTQCNQQHQDIQLPHVRSGIKTIMIRTKYTCGIIDLSVERVTVVPCHAVAASIQSSYTFPLAIIT